MERYPLFLEGQSINQAVIRDVSSHICEDTIALLKRTGTYDRIIGYKCLAWWNGDYATLLQAAKHTNCVAELLAGVEEDRFCLDEVDARELAGMVKAVREAQIEAEEAA